jgi:hypothetical protein
MHVSPIFNFAAMFARKWLETPAPPLACRIAVEALDGPFVRPVPHRSVPVPSFAKCDDNWS